MDRGELSNTLKRLCKVLWEANVTNPITYVYSGLAKLDHDFRVDFG